MTRDCAGVCFQASTDAQTKKLEEQLADAIRRGDDLQRMLTELSVAKNRLTGTFVTADHQRSTKCS